MKTIRSVTSLNLESNQGRSDDLGPESAQPAPIMDRTYFAAQVRLRWNKARKSILEVGHLLVDAKEMLPPEEYRRFFSEDVPFDYSTLQKLRFLAQNARINDPRNEGLLPHSWNTLCEIAHLSDDAWEAGIERHIVHPGCRWKEVKALRREFDPEVKGRGRGTESQPKREPVDSTPERHEIASGGQPEGGSINNGTVRSRIAVNISQKGAKENPDQLAALREEILVSAAKYPFVESVEIECYIPAHDAIHELIDLASSNEAEAEPSPVMTQNTRPEWPRQCYGGHVDELEQPDAVGRVEDLCEADQLPRRQVEEPEAKAGVPPDKLEHQRNHEPAGPGLTTEDIFQRVCDTVKNPGRAKVRMRGGRRDGRRESEQPEA